MNRELNQCPWCKATIKTVLSGQRFKNSRTAIRTEFLCGVVQTSIWSSKKGTEVFIELSCKKIKTAQAVKDWSSLSHDRTKDLLPQQTLPESSKSSNPVEPQEF